MHTFRTAAIVLLAGLFCSTLVSDARAQQVGRLGNLNATGVPYHVYAETGDPTIRVYVVGGNAGGVYDIGVGTRLDEFFAIASVQPSSVTPRSRERTTVRLYRVNDLGQREVILEGRTEELLSANPDTYPRLREGDFIEVELRSRERFGWRDGLRIITSIGSIIVLGERIASLF